MLETLHTIGRGQEEGFPGVEKPFKTTGNIYFKIYLILCQVSGGDCKPNGVDETGGSTRVDGSS